MRWLRGVSEIIQSMPTLLDKHRRFAYFKVSIYILGHKKGPVACSVSVLMVVSKTTDKWKLDLCFNVDMGALGEREMETKQQFLEDDVMSNAH